MAKLIAFDEEARRGSRPRGLERAPRGRRPGRAVLRSGTPTITNDGVSIAKEIKLEDRWEKIKQLVKEVGRKPTTRLHGDGTTTATGLVKEGLRN